MRFKVLFLSAIAVFTLSSATVFAQNDSIPKTERVRSHSARRTVNKALAKQKPRVSTEFGLAVLGKYSFIDVVPVDAFPHKITTNFGVGASLQFRVNFGRYFGFQPEVQYAFSILKFRSTNGAHSPIKVKDNLVQMPLLLSLRLGIVDINFGPVFRLMDNNNYVLTNPADKSTQQLRIGNIMPLVTYAAGVSVKLPKNMVIDLRYMGQFKDIKSANEFLWTLDQTKQEKAERFRTRNSSIQLRFGFIF